MKEFIDRIIGLPTPQKIGVLAGLIAALLALDYTFLYSGQSLQVSAVSDEVNNLKSEREKKKVLLADPKKLQAERQELEAMLKEALAQLPERKEIPDLLSNISTKAREAGLEILLFRPRAENLQEFYAEVPVDVVVRGGFHNVVTFFDEVGRLTRLVNINNIELKNLKVNDDQILMDASSLATTFRFLDEAERAKIAAEKAAKEKKK
jgi:type IV pilus assembly protein PilO